MLNVVSGLEGSSLNDAGWEDFPAPIGRLLGLN
jgi:hypothetical protein